MHKWWEQQLLILGILAAIVIAGVAIGLFVKSIAAEVVSGGLVVLAASSLTIFLAVRGGLKRRAGRQTKESWGEPSGGGDDDDGP